MYTPALALLLASLHPTAATPKSWTRQMTIEVPASREDCFFIPDVKIGNHIGIEYQVTDSSSPSGNLDIYCRLLAPQHTMRVLFQSDGESTGNFDAVIEEDGGEYSLCFSNYMSTWSEKTVWFEVTVKRSADEDYSYDDEYIESEDMEQMKARNADDATLFEMTVDQIRSSLSKVRTNSGRIRHYQLIFSASMTVDSNQASNNMEKVDLWSTIHLSLILVVGIIQVFMIRQLFEDKSFIQGFTSRK